MNVGQTSHVRIEIYDAPLLSSLTIDTIRPHYLPVFLSTFLPTGLLRALEYVVSGAFLSALLSLFFFHFLTSWTNMKRRETMQPVAKFKFIGRIGPWVRERRALSTSRANDRTPFAYSHKSTIACKGEIKKSFVSDESYASIKGTM